LGDGIIGLAAAGTQRSRQSIAQVVGGSIIGAIDFVRDHCLFRRSQAEFYWISIGSDTWRFFRELFVGVNLWNLISTFTNFREWSQTDTGHHYGCEGTILWQLSFFGCWQVDSNKPLAPKYPP